MTRSDLVEALAERFGQLTQRDAEFAVKSILDAMSEANPRSGEKVAIPEKRVPHFKPGKALREQVDARTPAMLGAAAAGRVDNGV